MLMEGKSIIGNSERNRIMRDLSTKLWDQVTATGDIRGIATPIITRYDHLKMESGDISSSALYKNNEKVKEEAFTRDHSFTNDQVVNNESEEKKTRDN
uniref:Uncharacterized protein n=2 Tax=Caenorhabditis tropicalis TaxID=1561998 RepID=A0A1I7TA22_9PELO